MTQIGYCTNVHAGPDLESTRQNLRTHAEAVKQRFSPDRPMGVGLWLAAPAARQLRDEGKCAELRDYLQASGLLPFTLNGFPYGDFHQQVVKHAVYRPTWMDAQRLEYTRDLIAAQHRLLPPGVDGSISTLPVAWGEVRDDRAQLAAAAENIAAAAAELAELRAGEGRLIRLCIEPEPGCVMDRAEHIVDFFQQHLLPGRDAETVLRHVQVCHDICHSAVMFERQEDALRRYAEAGIGVGKVQVSSAVSLPLDLLPPGDRQAAIEQLAAFNEPRYLHQSMHRAADGRLHFFEDLAPALEHLRGAERPDGELRVHFHVPIYLEQFGALRTTRPQVLECLRHVDSQHFEVETYAWSVLPEELQQPTLAAGIAAEMEWFAGLQETGE